MYNLAFQKIKNLVKFNFIYYNKKQIKTIKLNIYI